MYFRFMDDVTFGRTGPYSGRCDTEVEYDVYEYLVIIIIIIRRRIRSVRVPVNSPL